MDFFIADTHFSHGNIITYCHRPFINVEEMDRAIIDNWNRIVRPDDTVFHLGDFSLTGKSEGIKRYLDALNGHIILTLGNHDVSRLGFWAKLGVGACKKPIEYGGMILSHYPVLFPEIPNVHGHTHRNLNNGEVSERGIHLCVSVEVTEYEPKSIEWVKNRIEEIKIAG